MMTRSLRDLLRSRGLRLVHLARLAAVDKATVTRWAQNKVPAERVLEIEKITGISRCDLRPDLYPQSSPTPLPAETEAAA